MIGSVLKRRSGSFFALMPVRALQHGRRSSTGAIRITLQIGSTHGHRCARRFFDHAERAMSEATVPPALTLALSVSRRRWGDPAKNGCSELHSSELQRRVLVVQERRHQWFLTVDREPNHAPLFLCLYVSPFLLAFCAVHSHVRRMTDGRSRDLHSAVAFLAPSPHG